MLLRMLEAIAHEWPEVCLSNVVDDISAQLSGAEDKGRTNMGVILRFVRASVAQLGLVLSCGADG
eukprot:11134267-Prorocentrum_lima.AAC.1